MRHQLHPDWPNNHFASEMRKKLYRVKLFFRREIFHRELAKFLVGMDRWFSQDVFRISQRIFSVEIGLKSHVLKVLNGALDILFGTECAIHLFN